MDSITPPTVPICEDTLPLKFLKQSLILPLEETDDGLTIALTDPEDLFLIKAVELATGKTVTTKTASPQFITDALDRLRSAAESISDIVEEIDIIDDPSNDTAVEKLKDLATEAPIVRLVNLFIKSAVDLRASDIHIEPFENRLKVRYRIDGVLQEAEEPPAHSTAAIISRIKIMAKMNIAERRLPQDGRIQLKTRGKLIDLRVSTVPTMHGESLVLRILDKETLELSFDALGFTESHKATLDKVLARPHGIILVTGPTGSGKTTTLYTALQKLNTPERKILTVEDPVEYQLDGINQIQVKPKIGLDFPEALRSIVRQDPDVIMIGEMRDIETARISIQSALTGHLVLSTLHTNDAGSSITRLLDMGAEDYLLTSTINAIVAQRLLRTLCEQCKEPYTATQEVSAELRLDRFTESSEIRLFYARGCESCAETGYKGRTIILEVLLMTETVRRLILSHADSATIQNAAIELGMSTMNDDGLRKAVQGITTIEEVARVTEGQDS